MVPRGTTNSPDIPYTFNPLFGVGDRIADSQTYKALEGLAKAANTWNQLKCNVLPQQGRELLRELASRNSDLANSLKSGLTKGTLRFYDHRTHRNPICGILRGWMSRHLRSRKDSQKHLQQARSERRFRDGLPLVQRHNGTRPQRCVRSVNL